MPTLIAQNEIKLDWSDIQDRVIHPRPDVKRSTGVHVSGVIKHVLVTSGLLTVEDQNDEFPLRMALGMAWEDWVVGLWPEMQWQPGEISLDEIYGSPDGLEGDQLQEFKATWKSVYTRQDITKEKMWMWQLAAYLKILGLNNARLHVLWVNGTYRPPAPLYVTYELEFTQKELDQFWNNVMLKNKNKASREAH